MRRGYILIITLLISSLACGLFTTNTPLPTDTIAPTKAIPTSTSIPPTTSPTQAPANTRAPRPTGAQTTLPEATTSPTQEEPTKTPYPTSVLDKQLSQEIELIQSQVIDERGLQPKSDVPVVLLSPDQLRQNVINDFLADYTDEESADDVLELTAIGLLEPGFDFRDFYIDLLSEQVAGYYDGDVKEMFVVQGEGFEGPERMTYAHEFTHVLQDQTYDIEHGLNYNDDACEADSERCAAIQALIEGDATQSELSWFQYYATRLDRQQITVFYDNYQSPVYDQAPAFMKEDFGFPYNQGYAFVQTIYDEGGWSAVDDVYSNPPVSTEQILHPDLYPGDTPIPVDLPDVIPALGNGWHELSRNQMGEWYTYLILARGANSKANLDDTTAQDAAAGWGGDEYVVLHNDTTNSTVFVMETVWDSTKDATEFANALQKYANIRFGVKASQQGNDLTWSYSGGYSTFYHSGDTTIWIITPDAETAQTISSLVQP